MRIVVNLTAMNPQYRGGINSYIQGLLGGWKSIDNKSITFNLVCREDNQHLVRELESDARFRVSSFPVRSFFAKGIRQLCIYSERPKAFRSVLNYIWSDITSACDQLGDIIYTPTTVLTAYNHKRPTVVSMHDIQHVHFPQFFSKSEHKSRRLYFDETARFATAIQASSHFIQSDLLSYYKHLNPDKIPVISEGVDIDLFSASPATSKVDLMNKYGLPDQFLFYPAQLWPHKNHITILKALSILKKNGLKVPLVLTGAKFGAAEALFSFISDSGLGDQIHYLGLVPFSDLVGLYRSAQFLIVAVLYESNSLPILEAAAAGTPIIASDTPPNRELTEHLKLTLFDPLNEQKLAEVISAAWNSDWRQEHVFHNQKGIQNYSWTSVGSQYLKKFHEILSVGK